MILGGATSQDIGKSASVDVDKECSYYDYPTKNLNVYMHTILILMECMIHAIKYKKLALNFYACHCNIPLL